MRQLRSTLSRLRRSQPSQQTLRSWVTAFAITGVVVLIVYSAGVLVEWGMRVQRDWTLVQKDPSELNERELNASLEGLKSFASAIGTIATIAGGVVLYLNFRVANRNAQIANRNAEIAANNLKLTELKLEQDADKARKDAELAGSRLITDRFSKAVEQIGSDKVEVRLGGIYALERIARDSRKDHWPIMEILSAYVRERSPKGTGEEVSPVAIDIQAALTVIGRRNAEQDQGRIDLRNTNLFGANLVDAQLQGADLVIAQLHKANLSGTNLSGASLNFANLSHAKLNGANLESASFQGVRFAFANLGGAKGWTDEQLREAHFWATTLPEGSMLNPNRDGEMLAGPRLSTPLSSPLPDVPNPPSSGDCPKLDSPALNSPDEVDGNPT